MSQQDEELERYSLVTFQAHQLNQQKVCGLVQVEELVEENSERLVQKR